MLDLHVSAEVPLQVELTGAVRTLEGLAASVQMHVAQQVVHSVERLATHLGESGNGHKRGGVMNTRALSWSRWGDGEGEEANAPCT